MEPMETSQKKGKPNRVALTLAKARDAKPPAKGDYILWDTTTRGFGLRVYSTGAKVWVAQKKLGKTPSRRHLGHFPDMALSQARQEAEDVLAKIRKGIDPNLERRQQLRETEKARDREKLTIGFAFEKYLAFQMGVSEDDKACSQNVDTVIIPLASANTIRDLKKAKKRLETSTLWKLPIEAVDVDALYKEYLRLCRTSNAKRASNGGRTSAGGIFRNLRAAYNWTVREYKLNLVDNPFQSLSSKKDVWLNAPARKTVVADAEGDLGRWWNAVEALRSKTDARARDSATIADWLQVALLVGGRKTESLSLRWEDVDLERGVAVFRITKSGREHNFPIAPFVRSILERRKAINEKVAERSDYVFPASRRGWVSKERTHIKEPKKAISVVKKASGISFSAHDLRRTFGSLLNEMEVNAYTIKKALNHAASDVASRHYIQTRMKALLPIYERLETLVLTEAGVIKAEDGLVAVKLSQAELKEFLRWKMGNENVESS